MSKKTHEQQLAARKAQRQAERAAERARQRRMLGITIAAIVSVVVVIVGVVLIAANTSGKETPAAGDTPTSSQPTEAAPGNKPVSIPTALAAPLKRPTALPAEVDCTYTKGGPAAKKVNAPANGKVKASGTTDVTLKT